MFNSIVVDVDKKDVDKTIDLLYHVFADLPCNINRIFNCNFDLETRVEILIGQNMYDLKEYTL